MMQLRLIPIPINWDEVRQSVFELTERIRNLIFQILNLVLTLFQYHKTVQIGTFTRWPLLNFKPLIRMSSVETRSNFEILLRFSATGTMFTPLVNLSVRDCNYQKTDLNNFHVTPAPAISIRHKGSKSISVSVVKGRHRKRTDIHIIWNLEIKYLSRSGIPGYIEFVRKKEQHFNPFIRWLSNKNIIS